MPDVTLEPGSPSERICQHLRASQGLELTATAIAGLLNIGRAQVFDALSPGVEQGVITVANNPELGRVWRAGPRLAHWMGDNKAVAAPAVRPAPARPAPASTSPATSVPARPGPTDRRGGKRLRLPLLDLRSIKMVADVPLPPRRGRQCGSIYDALFDSLKRPAAAAVDIDARYCAALKKAAGVYCKTRPGVQLTVRLIPGTDTCGVWRLA